MNQFFMHGTNLTAKTLLVIIPVLVRVAFITLLERKILGIMGIRLGPNKTIFIGVLQPISDAIKLSNKQINRITNRSHMFYYVRSMCIMFCSLCLWTCLRMEPIVFG